MKQKVALALGSGGARGAAHIGVIRELEKEGYEISSISGTSMGALIGGIYAAGKLDEYESWLRSLSKMDIFNLVDFTLSTKKDDILVAVNVNSLIPYKNPKVTNPDLGYFEKLTNGKLNDFQKRLTSLFPAHTHKKENTGVGYFNLINETSSLMLSQISKLTLEMTPPDILIETSRQAYGTFDFYRSEEIIETGRNAANIAINNHKKQKK